MFFKNRWIVQLPIAQAPVLVNVEEQDTSTEIKVTDLMENGEWSRERLQALFASAIVNRV